MSKPRLWYGRQKNVWICARLGAYWSIGFGSTPEDAYADWMECRQLDVMFIRTTPNPASAHSPETTDG